MSGDGCSLPCSEHIHDPGVAAVARQARRVEQSTDDRALVRAGAAPSRLAERYAVLLRVLAEDTLSVRAVAIEGTPTAFHITGIGDEPGSGPTLIVHVLEVGR